MSAGLNMAKRIGKYWTCPQVEEGSLHIPRPLISTYLQDLSF